MKLMVSGPNFVHRLFYPFKEALRKVTTKRTKLEKDAERMLLLRALVKKDEKNDPLIRLVVILWHPFL